MSADPPAAPPHPSPPPTGDWGIYVHVPFCLRHCPYCDFTVAVVSRIPHEAYADAVLRELEGRRPDIAGTRLRTLYFGGGTPGLWEPASLGRVVDHVQRALGTPEEITVELNPEESTPDRLRALRALGVTRLSFGTQSFDEATLRVLGRAHDAAQARAALEAARAAGFAHVSADLILGVPGTEPARALEDVRWLATHAPVDHVSVYELTWEPRTSFDRRRRRGELTPWDEDLLADSWDAALEALGAGGFTHYEVSSHARPGGRSRHNEGYWRGDEYLGVGTGAHGLHFGAGAPRRTRTERRLRAYLNALADHDSPRAFALAVTEEDEVVSARTHLVEVMMGVLRTRDGWCPATLRARFGGLVQALEPLVREWEGAGWVRREQGRVRMTSAGMWRADLLLARVHERLLAGEGESGAEEGAR